MLDYLSLQRSEGNLKGGRIFNGVQSSNCFELNIITLRAYFQGFTSRSVDGRARDRVAIECCLKSKKLEYILIKNEQNMTKSAEALSVD